MFIRSRDLKYWNSFGCNLTGHLPPTVKRIAQRATGEYFEFFVQDEQLEYLADYRCNRGGFFYQRDYPPTVYGKPFKGNYARQLSE